MSLTLTDIASNIDSLINPAVVPNVCDIDAGSEECTLTLLAQDMLREFSVITSADPTTWKSPAHMIALVVQAIFATQLTFATNLFVGHQPDAPSACVTLYDSGGSNQNPTLAIDENHIQILSRSSTYPDGYNSLSQIKVALQSMPTVFVDSEKIAGIWVMSNIVFLRRDENDNSEFSLNLRVMIDTNKNIHRLGP